MPRYDFQSPGASAAGAVHDFLKQRNLEQRQAMLDALQRKDTEHGWGIQDENLKLNQHTDARAGELQKHNITSDLAKMAPQAGANIEDIGNADVVKMLEDTGNVRTTPGTGGQVIDHSADPAPTTDALTGTTPEAPEQPAGAAFKSSVTAPSRRYIGGETQQKIDMQTARIDEMMRANPALAKDADTARGIAMVRGGVAEGLPANLVGAPPSITPYTPTGKALPTINLPRGGQGSELNWQPSGYFGGAAANVPAPIQVPKPDGSGYDTYWVKPGQQASEGTLINNISQGPVVKGNLPAPKPPTAGLLTRYATIKGSLAEKEQKRHGRIWDSAPDAEQINLQTQLDALRTAIVSSTGARPYIVDVATDIASHPEASNMSLDELVRGGYLNAQDGTPLRPDELQQLQTVIGYLKSAQ